MVAKDHRGAKCGDSKQALRGALRCTLHPQAECTAPLRQNPSAMASGQPSTDELLRTVDRSRAYGLLRGALLAQAAMATPDKAIGISAILDEADELWDGKRSVRTPGDPPKDGVAQGAGHHTNPTLK